MPDPVIDLETLGKSILEALMSEAKSFYDEEGKDMLQEDKAFIEELALDSATATFKLAKARLEQDEQAAGVYKRDLEFISSTLRLRLMRRQLQLVEASRERLEAVLRRVLDILGTALPVLLQALV